MSCDLPAAQATTDTAHSAGGRTRDSHTFQPVPHPHPHPIVELNSLIIIQSWLSEGCWPGADLVTPAVQSTPGLGRFLTLVMERVLATVTHQQMNMADLADSWPDQWASLPIVH